METPYTLISKYLSSETSEDENLQLETWRSSSQENETEYQKLREIWILSTNISKTYTTEEKEMVWNKINSGIHQLSGKVKMYNRTVFYRTIGIAATIALFIGFGLSFILNPSPVQAYTTIIAPRGQKAQMELPDGSVVWLNSGSKLIYPTNFDLNNREVKLIGEAFFDITKSKKHQFKVEVGNVSINVFGTAFNVKGYNPNKKVEVALVRGKVSVNEISTGRLMTMMKPNQKVIVENNNKLTFALMACDAETISLWHYGKLKIENVTMAQIVEKMEQWYGVDINFKDNNNPKRYWMTIKTESLTEMLQVINKITPINYNIQGEEVIIRYKQ